MGRQLITVGAALAGAAAIAVAAIRKGSEKDVPSLLKLTRIEREGSILLNWEYTGASHKIYKDGELKYSGTGTSWCDRETEEGEIVQYRIISEKDGKKETAALQLMQLPSDRDEKDPLSAAFANTIVSGRRTIIFWEPVDGLEEYKVYKNGEYIKTIQEEYFVDEETGYGPDLYTFEAERPIKESEVGLAEEKFSVAKMFGLFRKRTKEKASMEKFILSKKVGPREKLIEGKKKRVSGNVHFRYTTFLSEAWLKNPNFFSMNRYFQGDGRWFQAEHSRFRTRADVRCTDLDIEMEKEISKSRAFNWVRMFREERRADDRDILLEDPLTDERGASFVLLHTAGNPLTLSPDIDYKVKAEFLRNGVYDISGVHDQSPNHEVYVKRGEEEWEALHQAENKGLAWMASPLANQYWRISNFE